MPQVDPQKLEFLLVEDTLWLATQTVGVSVYDFAFETFFSCRHPLYRPNRIQAVGRFGVTEKYKELYTALLSEGVELIHSPSQYALASELTQWYPLLSDLTPRSHWFATPPTAQEIEKHFTWPIFVKGSRQTSRHKAALSILRTRAQYAAAIKEYRSNPILHWQALVCREYIPLRKVPAPESDTIPASFEFRTFWWRGTCVGAGPYWSAVASYTWTQEEERQALAIAQEAANRLALPFLVVDVAQTAEGKWIVIEVNDAQESGYAGIPPLVLWQRVVELERTRLPS